MDNPITPLKSSPDQDYDGDTEEDDGTHSHGQNSIVQIVESERNQHSF